MTVDDIIQEAFNITQAVERLKERVRHFYYQVILIGHSCPECRGKIEMVMDNWCRCRLCGHEFDPTAEFQRCSCGGKLKISVRRYACLDCGSICRSRYAFDSVVYDREYFAGKMRESRQKKQQERKDYGIEVSRQRSNQTRYCAAEISSVPGLLAALNSLSGTVNEAALAELRKQFDLNIYQQHILGYVDNEPIDLRSIPAVITNSKLDIIWKFVAAIFLEHEGKILLTQLNNDVLICKNGFDRKR